MYKYQAEKIIGGLSNPDKMPCKSYGLPAQECITGSVLRNVCNSVCESCYAHDRGCYSWQVVKAAQYRRLSTIENPQWINAMVVAIGKAEYFRWHDSGDIQSIEHLQKIVEVCRATPNTRHWLPTKEKKIVRDYMRRNAIPDNLVIRLSGAMIDGAPPKFPHTSTVHDKKPPQGYRCTAPDNGGHCADCRACWNPEIKNISYHRH